MMASAPLPVYSRGSRRRAAAAAGDDDDVLQMQDESNSSARCVSSGYVVARTHLPCQPGQTPTEMHVLYRQGRQSRLQSRF